MSGCAGASGKKGLRPGDFGPRMRMDASLHLEKKPDWIRVKLPNNPVFWDTKSMVKDLNLVTVCEEAQCPNRWECWGQGTATFMIAKVHQGVWLLCGQDGEARSLGRG